MSTLVLPRTYTDETNNQMLNAIIDYVTSMKTKMVEQHKVNILEKNLNIRLNDIHNTLDKFIAYIQEISQTTILDEDIENIIKYDDKFYGFIQNLYLYSYDAYELIIELKDRGNRYNIDEINNYKAILNFTIFFLSATIDKLNEIKFKEILDNVSE